MSERVHEPEELLESLLTPDERQPIAAAHEYSPQNQEDLDALVDELEAVVGDARRVPFGRRLMVDEGHVLEIVDRLRAAIPLAVRQSQRLLEERERILNEAREQARQMLHERGLMAELDIERERMLGRAEQEADRMRSDADAYVRGILNELGERLSRIQASVSNGIDALNPHE